MTVVCLLAMLAAAPANGGARTEAWYIVTLEGQRVGYLHELVLPDPADGTVKVKAGVHMSIRRGASVSRVSQESVVWEKPDGSIVRFSNVSGLSRRCIVTEGRAQGDKALVTTNSAGRKFERQIPWDSTALGPIAVSRLYARHRKPGSTFHYRSFSPEVQATGTVRVTVLGKEGALTRYESRNSLTPQAPSVEWRDAAGRTVRMQFAMAGMKTEIRRAPKEEAMKPVGGSIPDLVETTSIRTGVVFPPRRRVESVTYRLHLPEGVDAAPLEGLNQKVTGRRGREVLLAVSAKYPQSRAGQAELKQFLASGPLVQCDDPLVKRAAEEAASGTAGHSETARACEEWVRTNVTSKNLDTAFAGAAEVARTREGDCTEHAVLTAALCRARGIPARVVVGFAYVDGAFLGHMWVEAYADGWLPLDATLEEHGRSALRIAFARAGLGAEDSAVPFLNLLPMMGRIGIGVVEVTVQGRTYEVGAPPSIEYAVDGATIRNRLFGFSLTVPEGWRARSLQSAMSPGAAVSLTAGGDPGQRISLEIRPATGAGEVEAPSGYTIESRDTLSVNGVTWTRAVLKGDGARSGVCACSQRDGYVYLFSATGLDGRRASDAALRALESIRLP